MNLDELQRLAEDAALWETSGYKLFEVNGAQLAVFDNEGPAALAAAARNALPALLAVARASARLAAAEGDVQRLVDAADDSEAQHEAIIDAHTRESDAYAVWRAAVAALRVMEEQP